MDTQTLLALCSIIACGVGVATFLAGMTTRAKNDGILISRIDYVCKQVDKIDGNLQQTQLTVFNIEKGAIKQETIVGSLTKRVDTIEGEAQTMGTRLILLEERVSLIDRKGEPSRSD